MATGGYNASFDEALTGFGSDNTENGQQHVDRSGSGGGVSSAPLMGIDYKRYRVCMSVTVLCLYICNCMYVYNLYCVCLYVTVLCLYVCNCMYVYKLYCVCMY